MKHQNKALTILLSLILVAGCSDGDTHIIVGTLERDRVTLVSEAPEPINSIEVREGEIVTKGQFLLVQDRAMLKAKMSAAEANRDQAAAVLAELSRGPRQERIDAALARRDGAQEALSLAKTDAARAESLYRDDAVSKAFLEQAQLKLSTAQANFEQRSAELGEMLEGATPEELDQSAARLAAAEASVAQLKISLDRLTVAAPVEARVEALPFEVGERPPKGATVAVLLAGTPFARVYVPVAARESLASAQKIEVRVEGVKEVFEGQLRFISAEAAFTPYFALTEHDRGRLTYIAEIDLIGESAMELPVGLPVEIRLDEL